MTREIRLPPLELDALTESQMKSVDAYQASRGHGPSRPYRILLRSPDVMRALNDVGVHVTYHSVFNTKSRKS